jgi:hypothetical protein
MSQDVNSQPEKIEIMSSSRLLHSYDAEGIAAEQMRLSFEPSRS